MFVAIYKYEIKDVDATVSYNTFGDLMDSLQQRTKRSEQWRLVPKDGKLEGWYDDEMEGFVSFVVEEK